MNSMHQTMFNYVENDYSNNIKELLINEIIGAENDFIKFQNVNKIEGSYSDARKLTHKSDQQSPLEARLTLALLESSPSSDQTESHLMTERRPQNTHA